MLKTTSNFTVFTGLHRKELCVTNRRSNSSRKSSTHFKVIIPWHKRCKAFSMANDCWQATQIGQRLNIITTRKTMNEEWSHFFYSIEAWYKTFLSESKIVTYNNYNNSCKCASPLLSFNGLEIQFIVSGKGDGNQKETLISWHTLNSMWANKSNELIG